jgi:hypothetical protein
LGVSGVSFDKTRCRGNECPQSGRQVVEDDHVFSPIHQGVGRVAADITGAASHEYAHEDSTKLLKRILADFPYN